MGAVSTTTIAGVLAVRRGLAKPIGSLTQMGTVRLGKRTEARSPLIKDFVPLASLDDVVFGGWDIFEDNCVRGGEDRRRARGGAARSDPAGARSDQADGRRCSIAATSSGSTDPNVKKGSEQARAGRSAARGHAPLQAENRLDRLVMVWCGSTEVYLTEIAGARQRRGVRKGARGERSVDSRRA